jgi:hypothetical protein
MHDPPLSPGIGSTPSPAASPAPPHPAAAAPPRLWPASRVDTAPHPTAAPPLSVSRRSTAPAPRPTQSTAHTHTHAHAQRDRDHTNSSAAAATAAAAAAHAWNGLAPGYTGGVERGGEACWVALACAVRTDVPTSTRCTAARRASTARSLTSSAWALSSSRLIHHRSSAQSRSISEALVDDAPCAVTIGSLCTQAR